MCNKIITIKGVNLTKVLVHDLSNTKLLATRAFLGHDSYGGLSAKGECAGGLSRANLKPLRLVRTSESPDLRYVTARMPCRFFKVLDISFSVSVTETQFNVIEFRCGILKATLRDDSLILLLHEQQTH